MSEDPTDIFKETSDSTDFSKVVDIMLSDDNLEKKTVLTTKQSTSLATLYTIAQITKNQFLKMWIPNYCRYMISSSSGRRRKDVTEIAKHFYNAKLRSELENTNMNVGVRK